MTRYIPEPTSPAEARRAIRGFSADVIASTPMLSALSALAEASTPYAGEEARADLRLAQLSADEASRDWTPQPRPEPQVSRSATHELFAAERRRIRARVVMILDAELRPDRPLLLPVELCVAYGRRPYELRR